MMYLGLVWLGSAICLCSTQINGITASDEAQPNYTSSSLPSTKESSFSKQAQETSSNKPYRLLDSAILNYLSEKSDEPNQDDQEGLREWKRIHQYVHFGKREQGKRSAGHNLMHFGKRGEEDYQGDKRGHNLMHFGKRSEDDYLGDKRGHNLMHFGKREQDQDFQGDKRGHNLMHFGKRDEDNQRIGADYDKKFDHHKLMHFGKRDGNEGGDKRGHNLMHFGKRSDDLENSEDKRGGHNLMHFGKRDEDFEFQEEEPEDKRDGHNIMRFGKRGGHNVMHFGKRSDDIPEDWGEDKRGGHNVMHFGKRPDSEVEESDKRAGHSLMHFGKRGDDVSEDWAEDKRGGHNVMHFGKRADSEVEESDKRAGHSLMHFGKKSQGVQAEEDYLESKRAGHNVMHFGKRSPDNYYEDDKRGHNLMHFGKREEPDNSLDPKRGHSMIHFGKRSDPNLFRIRKRSAEMKPDNETSDQLNPIKMQDESEAKIRNSRSAPDLQNEFYRNPAFRALVQEMLLEQFDEVQRDFMNPNIDYRYAKRDSGHHLMHFGKRSSLDYDENPDDALTDPDQTNDAEYVDDDDDGIDDAYNAYLWESLLKNRNTDKRTSHAMMHFGRKRPDHAMLHFGKRDPTGWMSQRRDGPADDNKRGHAMLHFGKRGGGDQESAPDQDNYGASYYRKRPAGHKIMRFGKRSVSADDQNEDQQQNVQNKTPVNSVRRRRFANFSEIFGGWPGTQLNGRAISSPVGFDHASRSTFLLPHALSAADMSTLHVPMFMSHLNRIQRAAYPYYGLVSKKDHKNVFLHFGKR